MATTQTVQHPPGERRRAPRRQPTQGTVCYLESGDGEQHGMGLVWNISTTGISMLLGKSLEAGTEVRGDLLAPDGRNSLGLTLRVAHMYHLRTGDYFLGGQFQRPVTEQELQPFVSDMARSCE